MRLAKPILTTALLKFLCCCPLPANEPATKPAAQKAAGIERREPWNSSKIVGTPEPPAPYRTQQVFPTLKFSEPLAMTWVPGSNRLLMVERHGKLYTFENSPTVEKADLLLDTGRKRLTERRFHPQFQNERLPLRDVCRCDDKGPAAEGKPAVAVSGRQRTVPGAATRSPKKSFSNGPQEGTMPAAWRSAKMGTCISRAATAAASPTNCRPGRT